MASKPERKTQTQLRAEQKKAAELQRVLEVVESVERDDLGEGDYSNNTWSHDMGGSKDVYIGDVCLDIDGRDLLTFTELRLFHGRKYGLVGRNGVGKTSLLRRLSMGKISGFPAHIRTYLVKQEVQASDKPVIEFVLAADTELTALLAEEQSLLAKIEAAHTAHAEEEVALTARLNEVYAALDAREASTARERAMEVLMGLQFSPAMMQLSTNTLSGGWRMRVALACGLFIRPDYLLLDEPTNHLDLPAILWLQDFLSEYDGSLVLVSHDRAFMNAVCTDIIHFTNKNLRYYQGDYDTFEKNKEERATKLQHIQETLDMKRDAIKESVEKMKQRAANTKKGADDKRLKQVSSRNKKLARMGAEKTLDGKAFNSQLHGIRLGAINAKAGGYRDGTSNSITDPPEPPVKFSLTGPEDAIGTKGPILTLKNVSFRYPKSLEKKPLLQGVSLEVRAESRIALLGANGAGKSTLLKIFLEQLEVTGGEYWKHGSVRLGHFAQTHVDQLDIKLTGVQQLQEKYPQAKEHECRANLAAVGLGGDLATQIIATMSGGQKSRVAFALIAMSRPHILVLDEPTNHLDFDTIQALIKTLQAYSGAVVLVSHDQALIQSVGKEMWMVADGAVTRLDGSFETYRRRVLQQTRQAHAKLVAALAAEAKERKSAEDTKTAEAKSTAVPATVVPVASPSNASAGSQKKVTVELQKPAPTAPSSVASKPRKGRGGGKGGKADETKKQEELEARKAREAQRLAMLF